MPFSYFYFFVIAIVAKVSPNWVKKAAKTDISSTVLSFAIKQASAVILLTKSQESKLITYKIIFIIIK